MEVLSSLALQGYSRFSLRDIGTLFPIWPTGHRHTIPDLAYGTSAASRVGVRWGSCERGHPYLPSVTVYIKSYQRHSIAHHRCKVDQATQDDPRPALAVIQKVSVQRRRHGNWVLWLIYLLYANRHRRTYTHTSPPLKVMVPPLISVFRSNMLSPPKDANPLVCAISYRVCLRGLLHIELCHDFAHNSDKKISIIDKLLQISMATKYDLVNDCVKVARRKGIFQHDPESVHMHAKWRSRILSFI